MAKIGVNVDMIIQSAGQDGLNDISFTVGDGDLKKTLRALNRVRVKLGARIVTAEDDVAKVAVVGVGMRSHPGVAARMFRVLADHKINIQMISTSEIKISCVIDRDKVDAAVKVLHKEFELEKSKALAKR
jgi:aspartate kinase